MNSLSWMIYAAEALGSLQFIAGGFMIASAIGLAVSIALTGLFNTIDGNERTDATVRRLASKWWVPVALGVITILAPSSKTIYLIAASEAGETIVTSPEAKEVFDDLKTIIKSKLKEQLPKAD